MLKETRIAVDQATLDRIHRRVSDAAIGYAPDDDADWSYGVDARWLNDLRDFWRDAYDWRTAEEALNAVPQVRGTIDGIDIHAFRFPAEGGKGYPLLLTHGWPGSPLEFMAAARLLAAQGFEVIVPSLPGYAFSGRPPRPIPPSRVAELWRLLMEGLGHQRFGAQGGDWGSAVTRYLSVDHAGVVDAIRLNMMHVGRPPNPSPDYEPWRKRVAEIQSREGAYAHVHGTTPQTIGLALADTPIGFAAWVIEKCRAWSDCGGDVESVFSKWDLVTNAMTHLVSGNVQGGIWMYHGRGSEPFAPAPICVPTGFAEFPAEFVPAPPRADVEQTVNIVRWTKMPKGGHFPAWEQPELFAEEVGSFFSANVR